jgi:hypothetical protein
LIAEGRSCRFILLYQILSYFFDWAFPEKGGLPLFWKGLKKAYYPLPGHMLYELGYEGLGN